MNSQDIFRAIISDDNVTLLEAVQSVLYEKSNLLVEDFRIIVAENMLIESYGKDEYGGGKDFDIGYGKNKVYGRADGKPRENINTNSEQPTIKTKNKETVDAENAQKERDTRNKAAGEKRQLLAGIRSSKRSTPEERMSKLKSNVRDSRIASSDKNTSLRSIDRIENPKYNYSTTKKPIDHDALQKAQNDRNFKKSDIGYTDKSERAKMFSNSKLSNTKKEPELY